MKTKLLIISSALLVCTACNDLNLNPLSEGSSDNWYSDETEIKLSLNDAYRLLYWSFDSYTPDFMGNAWCDDWSRRDITMQITNSTINGEWSSVKDMWSYTYKGITRSNTILEKIDELGDNMAEGKKNLYRADARFIRACRYSILISYWGDVPYYTSSIDIDQAFSLGRTSKTTILKAIYEDFDFAAQHLPKTYASDELRHATKGAAFAMKARIALYQGDYELARNAADSCIKLGIYSLHSDFGELFLSKTKDSEEMIFAIPRSIALEVYLSKSYTQSYVTRLAGGYSTQQPSWDLFCAFLCKDGLPIDESPLYDPHNPFKNRDPRCAETIVEFGTPHLGFSYQPHPDSTKIMNYTTGKLVSNKDNRTTANPYASYNGLMFKKCIDEDYSDEDRLADPPYIVMRYADVLLMYAEAKIELNEIDASVLNAINQVRARAYGVAVTNTSAYPAVTTTDQAALRKTLRIERRMEFAQEGTLRYMDLIRWRLAEKVLNIPTYGLLDAADLKTKIVKKGLWFFPSTPEIDEDGVADFKPMYDAGLIKILAIRTFDKTKQYLWPIPSKEIIINPNLTQNPNY